MEDNNKNFYFTYGTSSGFPFKGGWTQIIAPDRETACEIFRNHHPDRNDNTLNFSFMYDEDEFKNTSMYKNGNFGARCHEILLAKKS